MVHRCGVMAPNLSAIGRMIKQMARAALSMPMAMFMKVNGSMIRPMVRERMSIVTVLNLSVIMLKIGNMALASRYGPIMLNLRAILSRVRSMVWELSGGTMDQFILVSFITTTFMGREFIRGVTVGNMKVTGEQIRCMVKACSPGPTAENTSASIETIKRRAMVSSFGLMADAIEVNGLMASRTAKVHMFQVVDKRNMVSGKMVRELDGLVALRAND